MGENLRHIREAKGINQKTLAEMVNVSQPMIAQIERGTKTISMGLGKDIAKALGVSIMELFPPE